MKTSSIDTHSIAARTAYAQMITKLFALWILSADEELSLLGLKSHRTVQRYRQGAPVANRKGMIERIGHLLAIHRSLRILLRSDRELVYTWIKLPNKDLGDLRPLDLMLRDGTAGIATVRSYLERERER